MSAITQLFRSQIRQTKEVNATILDSGQDVTVLFAVDVLDRTKVLVNVYAGIDGANGDYRDYTFTYEWIDAQTVKFYRNGTTDNLLLFGTMIEYY